MSYFITKINPTLIKILSTQNHGSMKMFIGSQVGEGLSKAKTEGRTNTRGTDW